MSEGGLVPVFHFFNGPQTTLRKRYTYLLILLACGLWQPVSGQPLHFQRYGIKEGLVHSGTGSREVILQDREGFIWFSTHHGISRFDGMTFKNFRDDPANPRSIGNNFTIGIVEADDGKIWVGTADEGLVIFDPETESFASVDSLSADACGHGINTLNKDREGNIWIGTRFDGFCRWVKRTGQFERVGDLIDGHHFYQQKDGTIWLGEVGGLYKLLPDGTLRHLPFPPGVPDHWRYRAIQDQVELPNGRFLLTSSFESFWEFDPVTETFKDLTKTFRFENARVPNSFLADEDGAIWIGAVGELWRWDPADGSRTTYPREMDNPYSLPGTMIPSLAKDRAGSLWLITAGEGVAVAHDLDNPFELIEELPFIQLFPLDERRIIAWTQEGAYFFDTQQGTLTPAPELPLGPVDGLYPKIIRYSEDQLLISDGNQSLPKRYHIRTGVVEPLPRAFYNYNLRMAGSRIWDQLRYLDEEKGQWVEAFAELRQNIPDFIPSTDFFNDILHDAGQSIWISTTRGLFWYDLATKASRAYRHDPADPHAIPSLVCQEMFKGADRRLYLTTTNGLAVYDPGQDRFDVYNKQNGLLHDVVHTVVEDANGNPWIGTALGLQKLDLTTGTFTNYDRYDGMPGEFINPQESFRDAAGRLYFLTGDQAFRFHPDSLPRRDAAAPVYLLDLFLNHSVVGIGAEDGLLQKMLRYTPALTLPFDRNDFGFSFVMPVFYKPEKTTYYYRLMPYQQEWKSAGTNRETHYTNIDPGEYTFEVKARTANGTWSTREASVRITVLPPWYRTWWATTLLLLLLSSAGYATYRLRLNRALDQAERRRLRDLNTFKTRFYTNITHEFRTPLTVIMGMTDRIRGHATEKNLIQRNSRSLLRLINQLLDLSKLDSGAMTLSLARGDIINYLRYLTESFHSMAQEKKVRLTFYSEVDALVMDFDEEKIQQIVYNLLSNALKFTGEGGKVVLHANRTEGRPGERPEPCLQLNVQDTGIGIARDQLARVFDRFYQAGPDRDAIRKRAGTGIGLALTRELVERMGGGITVKSEVGRGSTFTLLLPVRLAEETLPASARRLAPDPLPVAPGEGAGVLTAAAEGDGERPLLLIIEDNADVVTYLQGLLEQEYEVHVAADGRLGVEKARKMIPDIIISDVMMPEMDGYEVCERLKKDERTSHVPIILLTAKAEETDRIAGLRKGADAYLRKPFNQEELFARLEQLRALRRTLQLRYAGAAGDSRVGTDSAITTEPTLEDHFLQKLRETVLANLDDDTLGAEQLSHAVQLSTSQLYRKLSALTGEPPNAFIRKIRLGRAMEMLKTTDLNISEIAYSVGFNDPNYFSRAFGKEFGHTPSAYRK